MGEGDIPSNFKTSLPPRKRAKTKEEKEQRRIERILRNRKAAHASREKKRKHVEFLESYVVELEKQMQLVGTLNDKLLACYSGNDGEVQRLAAAVASLPDLAAKKLQHAKELDSVGCEDEEEDEEVEQMPLPKTPESFTSSPQSFPQDVPELEESRTFSVCSQVSDQEESFTPSFTSEVASPVTTDKFSLNIISANSDLAATLLKSPTQAFQEVSVKREVLEEFVPSISEMNQFDEKLSFDDYQVKLDDNDYGLGELRNSDAPSNAFDLNDFMMLDDGFQC